MRTKKKVLAQCLSRKEKQLEDIVKELSDVHDRLRDWKEVTFEELLKRGSKNIPGNQVWRYFSMSNILLKLETSVKFYNASVRLHR